MLELPLEKWLYVVLVLMFNVVYLFSLINHFSLLGRKKL